ncbi:MAG: LptE family protein [Tepidisphaeraceae bacterium]
MSRVGIACVLMLLLPGGCVSHGGSYHWSSLYRQDISTVAVPLFSSKDYHRGVEFQVSDALVKKIEEFTPYKVVPRERADTILEGEIVAVRPLTVTLDPHTATPQEQQYTIVVNFTWKNLHDGKVLVNRRDFEQTSNYYPTLGEGQYVAAQTAAERLALAIVHEMEAPW